MSAIPFRMLGTLSKSALKTLSASRIRVVPVWVVSAVLNGLMLAGAGLVVVTEYRPLDQQAVSASIMQPSDPTDPEEEILPSVFDEEPGNPVGMPAFEDPILTDAELSDRNESADSSEDYESSKGGDDRPFSGKYWNSAIGIGGGSGGAYAGRFGGRRDLRNDEEGRISSSDLREPGQRFCTAEAMKRRFKPHASCRPGFAEVSVGGSNRLDLVRMEVRVTIEGHRARTVVDHVFRNPHQRMLEGTFKYPVPSGASVCGYAMYVGTRVRPAGFPMGKTSPPDLPGEIVSPSVAPLFPEADRDWGELRQARVVKRDEGREAFEKITRVRIDPALLEKDDGNFFTGRVFPIQPLGMNRVIIAYEETLPMQDGRMMYRFPLPDAAMESLGFAFNARSSDSKSGFIAPANYEVREGGGVVACTASWAGKGPGGDAFFEFAPANPGMQVISGSDSPGETYFHARLTVLGAVPNSMRETGRAVFMIDTSASSRGQRSELALQMMETVLRSDDTIKMFSVLSFDSGARFLRIGSDVWAANGGESREAAKSAVRDLVFEGGTDLGSALDLLANHVSASKRGPGTAVFLLSDGNATMGETGNARLAAKAAGMAGARFFCYRFGLGDENADLFRMLASEGGGFFSCFSPADIQAACLAHRKPVISIRSAAASGVGVKDFLMPGGMQCVSPGGEVEICGKASGKGVLRVSLSCREDRLEYEREYSLRIDGMSPMAGRAFGEAVVRELESTGNPALEDLIVAYCQRFNIASGAASFLVLERDSDYKRFGIGESMASSGLKNAGMAEIARFKAAKGSEFDMWAELIRKAPIQEAMKKTVTCLAMRIPSQDWLPACRKTFDAPVVHSDAGFEYLLEISKASPSCKAVLDEALRRKRGGEAVKAVRALTSLLDLPLMEPGVRETVAYRLACWGSPAGALPLFMRVIRERPFEPQPWIEAARTFEMLGMHRQAVICYEVACSGNWDRRFNGLREVILEEYGEFKARTRLGSVRGLDDAWISELTPSPANMAPVALSVTVTWNTDNTDVDLWVIEPSGEKVLYDHPRSASGAVLSCDFREGYGPERYKSGRLVPGTYRVFLNYYAGNVNRMGESTNALVRIATHAGLPQEKVRWAAVLLDKCTSAVEVCNIMVSMDGTVSIEGLE